jgi:hypothetical protein
VLGNVLGCRSTSLVTFNQNRPGRVALRSGALLRARPFLLDFSFGLQIKLTINFKIKILQMRYNVKPKRAFFLFARSVIKGHLLNCLTFFWQQDAVLTGYDN